MNINIDFIHSKFVFICHLGFLLILKISEKLIFSDLVNYFFRLVCEKINALQNMYKSHRHLRYIYFNLNRNSHNTREYNLNRRILFENRLVLIPAFTFQEEVMRLRDNHDDVMVNLTILSEYFSLKFKAMLFFLTEYVGSKFLIISKTSLKITRRRLKLIQERSRV